MAPASRVSPGAHREHRFWPKAPRNHALGSGLVPPKSERINEMGRKGGQGLKGGPLSGAHAELDEHLGLSVVLQAGTAQRVSGPQGRGRKGRPTFSGTAGGGRKAPWGSGSRSRGEAEGSGPHLCPCPPGAVLQLAIPGGPLKTQSQTPNAAWHPEDTLCSRGKSRRRVGSWKDRPRPQTCSEEGLWSDRRLPRCLSSCSGDAPVTAGLWSYSHTLAFPHGGRGTHLRICKAVKVFRTLTFLPGRHEF